MAQGDKKGLPRSDMGRIALDYFRKDPRERLSRPLRKSRREAPFTGGHDGGESWVQMPAVHYDSYGKKSTDPNPWYRPYYNQLVCFDPINVNKIYYSNVYHYTLDGGKTFVGLTGDDHALWIDPANQRHFIEGADDGINQGWKITDSVKDLDFNHLKLPPLDQCYSVGYDMRKLYWVMGNMQDGNAYCIPTQTIHGEVVHSDAIKIFGGEGGASMADPNDWTTVYASDLGLMMNRFDLKTGISKQLFPAELPSYSREDQYEQYKKMDPKIRAGWNAGFQIFHGIPIPCIVARAFCIKAKIAVITGK